MVLILGGFVVFTTRCFMLSLALFFVLMIFPVLLSIVISSLEEKRAGLCASREFVCFTLHALLFILFLSWCWGWLRIVILALPRLFM